MCGECCVCTVQLSSNAGEHAEHSARGQIISCCRAAAAHCALASRHCLFERTTHDTLFSHTLMSTYTIHTGCATCPIHKSGTETRACSTLELSGARQRHAYIKHFAALVPTQSSDTAANTQSPCIHRDCSVSISNIACAPLCSACLLSNGCTCVR